MLKFRVDRHITVKDTTPLRPLYPGQFYFFSNCVILSSCIDELIHVRTRKYGVRKLISVPHDNNLKSIFRPVKYKVVIFRYQFP